MLSSRSWTTDIEIAKNFAQRYSDIRKDGVVLSAVATPEAVLHVMGKPTFSGKTENKSGLDKFINEDRFDESEVIVDPFKLKNVAIVRRLPAKLMD